MNKNLILSIALVFATISVAAQVANDSTTAKRRNEFRLEDTTYPNAHDPVVAREGDTYYMFMTGFGISVLSSKDMQTWHHERPVFSNPPAWAVEAIPGYRGHTWAPDIQKVDSLWYLYYSCSTFGKNNSAIGLAVNKTLDPDSPDFKWVDRGMVIRSYRNVSKFNAIDPNLIITPKGTPWLTFGSFWDGIQIVRLSQRDFQTPVGKGVKTIACNWNPKAEKESGVEANNNEIEAPFIIRQGKYYYLFASTGLCCRGLRSTYHTVVGRSKKISGPYRDAQGRKMTKGGGTLLAGSSDKYAGVGHCSAYNFDGQWYFIAHAYDRTLNGASKLYVKKMDFEHGWPVLK